jgi:hypothetical protein
MVRRIFPFVLLLAGIGCAGPAITSRPVQQEASLFIRLDTFSDAQAARELRYNHPADWPQGDLRAILSRLSVQDRSGLLEDKPSPRPVFSSDEVTQLAPGLAKGLNLAGSSEWIAFGLTRSERGAQEITSGGMFLKDNRLHVVIANHRERVPPEQNAIETVRVNPLRPLGGKSRTLTFDPPRFVTATQSNWMGGSSGAPASELVVDYAGYLAESRPPTAPAVAPALPADHKAPATPTPPPSAAVVSPPPALPPNDQAAGMTHDMERMRRQVERQESEIAHLKSSLKELDLQKQELERLRRTADEQDNEIKQLKTRLSELETSIKKPPTKKPSR